jgi:hypothetical protein
MMKSTMNLLEVIFTIIYIIIGAFHNAYADSELH